jgi:hypothetical protein
MTRVKVAFPIENVNGSTIENMHALPLGNQRYVLDNSPFYAFDISFCDEFFADGIDGEIVFSKIASRGGHSTYRIKIPIGKSHDYFLKYWDELEKLGCTFEGSSANLKRLYAIDVPPGVDVFSAYKVMEKYEGQGVWEFEEGHYCQAGQAH